jgi:hypothetical protein
MTSPWHGTRIQQRLPHRPRVRTGTSR